MTNKTPYTVMVSSTYKELIEQRRVVREEMPNFRLLPIAMEDDAALPDQDLIDASLAKVEEADAYVGLIGYRYGQTPICPGRNRGEFSLTELEFRCAVDRKIPICMFIMHDEHPVPRRVLDEKRDEEKLREFIELAKKDRIYAEFLSVEDLRPKVVKSLGRLRDALEKRAASGAKASYDPGAKSLATPAKSPALQNIPVRVPEHFLGREDSLKQIEAALAGKDGRVAITALHGLRGVGKTTLAAAYAENKRFDYRATWWLRAQTPDALRADLVALGARLGWVGAEEREEPALKIVMEKLRDEGEGLLLIFDNANNSGELRDFLPKSGAAKVLITSNAPNWGDLAQSVAIRVWKKETGADFLSARTGKDRERAEAEKLSEALGGLPLAHEQAGAFCARTGISLGAYRKRFEETPVKLLDAEKDAPADYHDRLTVAKTFALAIEEAAKIHPMAEPFIVHAALLAPEPIPSFLLEELWGRILLPPAGEGVMRSMTDEGFRDLADPSEAPLTRPGSAGPPSPTSGRGDGADSLDEAIAALRAFALVDREEIADEREPEISFDTIRLHRLVLEVAARRREGEELEAARRALLVAVAAVYPEGVYDDPKTWPRARRLDAQALALVDRDAEPPQGAECPTSYLLDRLASYRHGPLAAYVQARALFERALAIFEKTSGPDSLDTAASLNNLAALLLDQRDFAGARPLFERALAIRQKVLGPEGADRAQSLSNLGNLLREQGDLASARPLFERAMAIYEHVLGPEHPYTASSLVSLAVLLETEKDLTGAGPLYERALAIWKKALGSDHPHTNIARGSLARLLLTTGDASGALLLAEAALAGHEKLLGPDHPWTKASAGVRALALDASGRGGEAAALRAKVGV